ncbi:MAG: 4Fe-4S binding protein [Syntrophobacterales bacterium]|jgi:ferredoxin|nr:4Fe-4S binding protein [Syntrophobacterales bacterium]
MIRKIIHIDEEKCDGCGLCAEACREGAIAITDGKARLIRDDYCDGLGGCLPVCPTDAITFEEREAAAYDEDAVKIHMAKIREVPPLICGCPGSHARHIQRSAAPADKAVGAPSALMQWPVQIKLVPVNAPYFDRADLLVAADCTAFVCGDFHSRFMENKITLIGCPKLDEEDYSEKLTAILRGNNIKSVAAARMEVPCCGGIVAAVNTALQKSGKVIPWQVIVISTDGRISQV